MTIVDFTGRTNSVGLHGNTADRDLGDYWEQQFILIASLFGWQGWQVTKLRGHTFVWKERRYIAPDVWLLRKDDKQYVCEVKHKNPTPKQTYGLEEYRAAGLVDLAQYFQNEHGRVIPLYVIHDWTENGNRSVQANNIHHWKAQYFTLLQQYIIGPFMGKTYYNGGVVEKPINYYNVGMFDPLLKFLT